MSHHRTLLDAITGRSGDDLQAVLLTHLRMSHTEPERYSTAARKPS
jgi:DNA-binding FadR family transcriptional regulator